MTRRASRGTGFARVASFGLFFLVALAAADASAQCAMCRDAAASAPAATREALNYAIIGLALTPYGVAAAAAWLLSPAFRTRVRGGLRRLRLVSREESA